MNSWLTKKMTLRGDITITFINGIIILGGVVFLNGMISRVHGLEVLGEYLLVKRTFSTAVSLFLLGTNMALTNYISRDYDRSYGDATLKIFIIVSIAIIVLSIQGLHWLQIEGIRNTEFWPYFLFSVGVSLQLITFNLFRGYMNMIGASFIQLVGTAIIPILLFLLLDDFITIITWIGITSIIVMLIGFFWRNKGFRIINVKLEYYKNLIIYGLYRIPSIISQFILLAGLPIMVAKTSNLENVAYFNSSISLLRLSLIFINPIGMVLLPRISQKLALGEKDKISSGLNTALYGGIFFSILSGIWVFIFAPLILEIWLGQLNTNGLWIMRGIIISFPFYTIAGFARSPIDAASQKGYNSMIYGLAAIFIIITYYLGLKIGYNPIHVAITSFFGGQIIAGVSSLLVLRKLFNISLRDVSLLHDIGIGSFMIILGNYILVKAGFTQSFRAIGIVLIGLIVMFYYYKVSKSGWLYNLRHEQINKEK